MAVASSSSSRHFACLVPSGAAATSNVTRTINRCWNHHIFHPKFRRSIETKPWRIGSLEKDGRKDLTIRRALSMPGDGDGDDDEDFLRKIQELALEMGGGGVAGGGWEVLGDDDPDQVEEPCVSSSAADPLLLLERNEIEILPASVERNANRVDLPLSLRIIKQKKKRWRWEQELLGEAGESARCSVKRAFSSMVFIVREMQSHVLRMRQAIPCQDLQGILDRVQRELHASFVWLFQRIFSCTPTLMVCLMILLANYTVYSMGLTPTAIAATSSSPNPVSQAAAATTVSESHVEHKQHHSRFGPSTTTKSFSVVGRTASVGGGGGGGGKMRPVAGATDDGSSSSIHGTRISTTPTAGDEEVGGDVLAEEDEKRVWNRILEEASRMQASDRDEALMDPQILQNFVSPVVAQVQSEDYLEHFQTELMYQSALSQDPDNALLLSNFAQFLYLVLHDHDRAEYYFMQAVQIQPPDAEALDRYASFLWLARKDLGAAEETYLEAIAADPGNVVYASNYAHFLWNTGGEDTCYPLDSP